MLVKKDLLKIVPPKNLKKGKYNRQTATCVLESFEKSEIIAVFVGERAKLQYRVFFDEKNYITYDEAEERWCTTNPFSWYSVEYDETISYFTDFSQRNFDMHATTPDSRISDIIWRKKCIKNINWLERFERYESMIPEELPNSVLEVFNQTAVHRSIVLGGKTKSGKHRIKCMACNRIHYAQCAPGHKTEYSCPKCGSKTIAISERYTSSSTADSKEQITFFVEHDDALLMIESKITRQITDKLQYKYWFDTSYFEVLDGDKHYIYRYKFSRWRYGDFSFSKNIITSENLDRWFRHLGIKIKPEKFNGRAMCLHSIITNYHREPELCTKLQNLGFTNLLQDVDNLHDGENFQEVFGISPNYKNRVRQWDITFTELRFIREVDCWVDDQRFIKIREIVKNGLNTTKLQKIKTLMSCEKIINYFYKQSLATKKDFGTNATLYIDYIHMFKQLYEREPVYRERFPSNILNSHDKLMTALKARKMKEREAEIKNVYDKFKELLRYKRGELILTMPKCAEDFIKEGNELNHCIATNEKYIRMHVSQEAISFFTRKKSNPEKPYFTFTIEMSDFSIMDCNGKNHSRPNETISKFIEGFINVLKKSAEIKEVA